MSPAPTESANVSKSEPTYGPGPTTVFDISREIRLVTAQARGGRIAVRSRVDERPRQRRLYAQYEITSGRRGLYAQRVNGHIALTDAPLDGEGRVYLVERHVPCLAELDGLCHAYIEHSTSADQPGVVASRQRLDALVEIVR